MTLVQRLWLVVILALGLSACTHVNRATLVASTAALFADGLQTRSAAERGWSHGDRETNPLLGATPSVGRVEVYFASAIVANAVLWAVLPPKWRSIVPMTVIGVQTQTIWGNLETTCVMGVGRQSRC
jgi:hypothetical protein